MTGGRSAREDATRFEEGVKEELRRLQESNVENVARFRQDVTETMESLVAQHRCETQNKLEHEMTVLGDLHKFFSMTLPDMKANLDEGRRKRREMGQHLENVLAHQSNVWLEVLEGCQRKCEETKAEVDSRLETFVDVVIDRLENI